MMFKIVAVFWAVSCMSMVLLSFYSAEKHNIGNMRKRWYDYAFDVAAALSVAGSVAVPLLA